ncbi:MAG: GGDEF domain-containing phosphodiesterase, partial [Lachnospiraceae bacterium]|nr:GGDEF domain-containing phosphodiesterase [Lachnospiraceae bacterium]
MKDLISFKELCTELDEDYLDPLTGLYSISGLRHIMRRALEKYDPDNVVEVIFFNVSEFALYNQTYDLTGGDKLLCDIADSLRLTFKNCVCARFAGDHFVVVTASLSMDREIMQIHNDVKMYGGKSMEIKAGIYEMNLEENIMEAIDCARLACISIKNRFDKTYRYYDNSLRQALNNKRYVLDHVDKAIEEGWLKVYYQPIVRIRSGEVSDFEALVRWDDPTYGMMQPNKFIPVLENSNQIYKIDMFVIEQVAKDLVTWREQGRQLVPVSVNLSRQDFDRDLCMIYEYIEEICDEYKIPSSLLDVEITESVLGTNEKYLRHELKKFNDGGFKLWMDDFGSGFSAFNVLKNYHFDVLKIDMNFLKEIEDEGASEKTKTILYSIIRMAKRLGMETVCEGTETEERLKLLASLGCEKAQGFYFSRPIPFEQIGDLDFGFENETRRVYEKNTGLVNVIDAPMAQNSDLIHHQPMTMIELYNGYARVLQYNKPFEAFFKGKEEAKFTFEKWANGDTIFSKHFHEAAARCKNTKEVQEIDFVLDGQFGVLAFDFISEDKESGMYSIVLRVENVQAGRGMKTVSLKQAAIRNVFTGYQFAHVFDIENNKVLLLYNGNSEYRLGNDEMDIDVGVRTFASKLIAPEDQNRFIEFYSSKHLKELYHSEDGMESNAFRTRYNDKYYWMIYNVLPFEYLDKWYAFSG